MLHVALMKNCHRKINIAGCTPKVSSLICCNKMFPDTNLSFSPNKVLSICGCFSYCRSSTNFSLQTPKEEFGPPYSPDITDRLCIVPENDIHFQ
jgi:hypothetical protein